MGRVAFYLRGGTPGGVARPQVGSVAGEGLVPLAARIVDVRGHEIGRCCSRGRGSSRRTPTRRSCAPRERRVPRRWSRPALRRRWWRRRARPRRVRTPPERKRRCGCGGSPDVERGRRHQRHRVARNGHTWIMWRRTTCRSRWTCRSSRRSRTRTPSGCGPPSPNGAPPQPDEPCVFGRGGVAAPAGGMTGSGDSVL